MATVGALIYKIGADTTELRSAVDDVSKQLGRLGGLAGTLGSMLGGLFAAEVIRETVEFADSLDELATGAGITTEALQKLSYAASQNGSSMEGVYKALQNMSANLGEGKLDEAIEGLGLSVEAFKALTPDEQMLTFADSLSKVSDQAAFAKLGTEVFGKSFKDLAPAIRSHMRDVADQAATMSGDVVTSIGSLGDTFDKVKKIGMGLLATVMAPMVPVIDLVAAAAEKAGNALQGLFNSYGPTSKNTEGHLADLREWVESLMEVDAKIAGIGPKVARAPLVVGAAAAARNYSDADMKAIYADLADKYDVAHEAAKRLSAEDEKILDLRKQLFGQAAIEEATKWLRAVGDVTSWQRMEGAELEKLRDKLTDAAFAYDRLGDRASASALRSATAATYISSKSFVGYSSLVPTITGTAAPSGPLMGIYLDTLPLKIATWEQNADHAQVVTAKWTDGLHGLADALARLGQVSGGGGFSAALKDVAAIVGAMEMGSGISWKNSNGKVTSSSLLAGGLQGIIAMQQATQSESTAANVLGGAATGASIGANPLLMGATGGLSVAFGAAAGGIYGAIKSLMGPSAKEKKDAQADDQIASAKASLMGVYGSLKAIDDVGKQLGVDLAGAWWSKGQIGLQQFNTLLDSFNAGLEKNKKIVTDLQALQPGELISQSLLTTIKTGGLTDDTKAALGQFITSQTSNLGGYIASYLDAGGSLKGAAGSGIFGATTATVGQMRADGMSLPDIFAAMGPTIAAVVNGTGQSSATLGLVQTAGSEQVAPLLKQADALAAMVTTLQNIHQLDAQTFTNLGATLKDEYDAVRKQVYSGDDPEAQARANADAITLLQPDLQKLWEVSDRTGMTLDSATQQLLDQAEASGQIGEQYKDASERLNDSIDTLIASIRDLTGAIGNVPATDARVDRDYTGDWTSRGGAPVVRTTETIAPAATSGGYMPVTVEVDGDALARTIVRVADRNGWN